VTGQGGGNTVRELEPLYCTDTHMHTHTGTDTFCDISMNCVWVTARAWQPLQPAAHTHT